MKKIMTLTILLALMIVSPLMAQKTAETAKDKTTTKQIMMQDVDSSMQKMKEMRQKIETTTNDKDRTKMMGNHMQMMQKMMTNMNMMGKQGSMGQMGSMGQQAKMGAMNQNGKMAQGGMKGGMQANASMPDRMAMMEKRMAMMQNMMGQGGMQGGGMQGNMKMNCMKSKMMKMKMKNSVQTLEKKMDIMQEMMNGLMTQQKMMMMKKIK